MEAMRLIRAIYRFQLLCHVADKAFSSSQDRNIETFLNVLEPWGVEQLFSFYQFVVGIYDGILNDIQWDIHPDNPKFEDQSRPPTPDGAFDLSVPGKASICTLLDSIFSF